jgi:hypothetical protein
MPLHVHFCPVTAVSDTANVAIGPVRAHEVIADGGTGSLTALDGEMAFVVASPDAVYAAHGSTPNAGATVSTFATTSRYVVPAGHHNLVKVVSGDKFAAAAIS